MNSLVRSKPASEDKSHSIKIYFKYLLKGYRRMDRKTRLRLIELGFKISYTGKHYKITHPSSSCLLVTIGNTVSDYRAGKNTVQYLCALL